MSIESEIYANTRAIEGVINLLAALIGDWTFPARFLPPGAYGRANDGSVLRKCPDFFSLITRYEFRDGRWEEAPCDDHNVMVRLVSSDYMRKAP